MDVVWGIWVGGLKVLAEYWSPGVLEYLFGPYRFTLGRDGKRKGTADAHFIMRGSSVVATSNTSRGLDDAEEIRI